MHADYIGDGVYVEWNGHAIVMKTQRGSGWDVIELDPDTLSAFLRYIKRLEELVKPEVPQ